MSEGNIRLLQMLLNIIIISVMVASPIVILILLMEKFDGYKKRKNKLKLDAERIVVRMNEDVDKKVNTVNKLTEDEKELKIRIYDLKKKKKELEVEVGEDTEAATEEELEEVKKDYSKLTIRELQDIARPLKISGFSRMKKDKLVRVLENYGSEDLKQQNTDKEQ